MRTQEIPTLVLSLYVVPTICQPLVSQPIATCAAEAQHLASLNLADYTDGERLDVDMLVGSDFYWDLVMGGVSRGAQGPIAIHTKLGWVLSGPTNAEGLSANLVTTHILRVDAQLDEGDCLEEQLRSFLDLESLVLRRPSMMSTSIKSLSRMADMRYHCPGKNTISLSPTTIS